MLNPIPSADRFRFAQEVEVRFRDLDVMGHVNNAVYLSYFEMARVGFMRGLGHCHPDERNPTVMFPFILAEVSCRFLAPAVLGDRLVVRMRTRRLGGKSFDFEYLISNAVTGQPITVGHSVQVYFDYEIGDSAPLPDQFRALLEEVDGATMET